MCRESNFIKAFGFCAVLVLNGCTVTYLVTENKSEGKGNELTQEEFLQKVRGEDVIIESRSGEENRGILLAALRDSILVAFLHDTAFISIRHIRSVTEKRYLLGALFVLPSSIFGGAMIGGLAGQATASDEAGKFWASFGGFYSGMIIGSAAGIAFGIIVPPKNVYKFSPFEY